jgi:hypothetical protein
MIDNQIDLINIIESILFGSKTINIIYYDFFAWISTWWLYNIIAIAICWIITVTEYFFIKIKVKQIKLSLTLN